MSKKKAKNPEVSIQIQGKTYKYLSGYIQPNTGKPISLKSLEEGITDEHKRDALVLLQIKGQNILKLVVEETPESE